MDFRSKQASKNFLFCRIYILSCHHKFTFQKRNARRLYKNIAIKALKFYIDICFSEKVHFFKIAFGFLQNVIYYYRNIIQNMYLNKTWIIGK